MKRAFRLTYPKREETITMVEVKYPVGNEWSTLVDDFDKDLTAQAKYLWLELQNVSGLQEVIRALCKFTYCAGKIVGGRFSDTSTREIIWYFLHEVCLSLDLGDTLSHIIFNEHFNRFYEEQSKENTA